MLFLEKVSKWALTWGVKPLLFQKLCPSAGRAAGAGMVLLAVNAGFRRLY